MATYIHVHVCHLDNAVHVHVILPVIQTKDIDRHTNADDAWMDGPDGGT